MRRIVVTGLGALTPTGNTVTEYWNSLIAGKSGAGPITRFDASKFKTRFACELKNFDPLTIMEKSEVRRTDLFVQFALAVVTECISDSGLEIDSEDLSRFGVLWGSGMGGMQTYEDDMFEFFQNDKTPRFNPFFITKVIPNIAPGQISLKYGLRGPAYTIAAACASSNSAIAEAFNLLRLGYADIMLAGGSEAPINSGPIGGFNAMRALSERNDSPETASRPFDVSRNGFVLGEGSGCLLLEELEHARARGAKIYCELAGCGLASDAYHLTASHPEGIGAQSAMYQAINMAGLQPSDVDYINAHATATPVGDISECKAIETLFGNCLDRLHISATKSMTGHLMGATGAVEAIAAIKAIENNIIPPTINQYERDPQINPQLQLTPNKALQKNVDVVVNNTFGFGGQIAVTLFKRLV